MASVKLSHLYFKHIAACLLNLSAKSVCLCVRVCLWVGGCVRVGTYMPHQLSKLYSSVVSIYIYVIVKSMARVLYIK